MIKNSRPASGRGSAWCHAVLTRPALLALANGGPANAGSEDAAFDWTGTYTGIFVGSGRTDNRIVDVEGFANWGNPGSTVDYDDVGFVGGALMGKKFDIGDIPFRIEIDGTFGHLSAKTNKLDPEGLDETAETEFRWNATARGGIEQAVGPATVFVTGGLSAARITNSATDIDFGADMPPRLDADDSFRDG